MPLSEAFIRIRQDVLSVVSEIPEGFVTTYRAVGEHLAVMPRHVAYLLSQLEPQEREVFPWHRVVSDKAMLSSVNLLRLDVQQGLLRLEGVGVSPKGQVLDWAAHFLEPAVFSIVPAGERPEQTCPDPN